MNLRPKTLAALAAATLCLAATLAAVFDRVILNRFQQLEVHTILRDVERAARALDNEIDVTVAKLADWAQWDDTYTFLADGNRHYIKTNVNYAALLSIKVTHMLWFRNDGTLFYGVAVDPKEQKLRVLSHIFLERPQYRDFVVHGNEQSVQRGIARVRNDFFIAASAPILTSEITGPIAGTLVFLRHLTDDFRDRLGNQTRLDVTITPVARLHQDPLSFAAFPSLTQEDAVLGGDRNTILGFHLVRDVLSKPAFVLRIDEPRSVFQEGVATRNTVVIFLLCAAVLFASLVMWLLTRLVIARVEVLTSRVQEITTSGDLTREVPVTGNDELTVLSGMVNLMLRALHSTQEQLAKAKAEAEAANEAKGRFVANISHELRTPIHGIIGMIRILLNMEQLRTKREYLTMAKDSATSLLQIINDILDLSKIEAGKLLLQSCAFDLANVVRDSFRTVGPKANEKGLVLLYLDDLALPRQLSGDPLRLKQIFLNLLGNAVKFTEHGSVTLRASLVRAGGGIAEICFAVEDTGIGIAKEKQASIFGAFEQADNTTARRAQGTGLGLSITAQLVELMGGCLALESSPGKGSVFSFSVQFGLPLTAASEDAGEAEPLQEMTVAFHLAQPELEALYTARCRACGAVVELPASTKELERWVENASNRLSHVLVINGSVRGDKTPEYLQRLLAMSQRFSVVVLLTADSFSLSEAYLALGACQILVRPILAQDLIQTLTSIRQGLVASAARADIRRSLRILSADDTKTNQMILKIMLEGWGHRVELVDDGAKVIAALDRASHFSPGAASEKSFDLLLLDIQMPVLDGIAVSRLIRQREKGAADGASRHLPIIATTATVEEKAHADILQAGADVIVTKPIEPESLLRALGQVLPPDSSGAEEQSAPSAQDLLAFAALLERNERQDEPAQEAKLLAFIRDLGSALSEKERSRGLCSNIIDAHALLARFNNDTDAARTMARIFLEEHQQLLGPLAAAIQEHSSEERRRAAHAIKGSLLNVGAVSAAAAALKLEALAPDASQAEASQLQDTLLLEVERLAVILQKLGALDQVAA